MGIIAIAMVVQEVVASFLIVLVLALVILGLLFAAALGRAIRNPGRPGERSAEGHREREERDREDGS